MPDKIVHIEGVGDVAFPDSMSDDQIGSVIQKQHAELSQPKTEEKPGALARFASAFDPRPLIKQIFKPAEDPNEDGFTSLAKNLLGIGKNLANAQGREYTEATKAYKEGRTKDAIAHGIAALTPVLGPMSQDAADKINSGDVAGGVGVMASMAAPEVVRGLPTTGKAAIQAAKAAPRAALKFAAAVPEIPGVAIDVAGAAAPPVAHMMNLVNRATRTARTIDKIIPPAETPVSRVANAFDPATARIQSPPVDPRVARVADAFNAETAWPADTEGIPPARMAPSTFVPRGTPADVEPTMIPRGTSPEVPPGGQPPAPPASGLQPIPPEPQPQMQGPIPYSQSVNPDVARTLIEGTQREAGKAGIQTLRRVPIEHIEGDPGNTIYPDRVEEYQKNGYAVHPELRANPEGGFTINEGHHRILADVRNGKDTILAWTPEDAAAERIKEITRPDTMAETMKDMPPAMRTAAADANYRAIKEGAPAADAGPVYESAARANKIETLGKHLLERGFTPEEMRQFPPAKLKEGLAQKVKELGINQTGQISDKSISDLLRWMEINSKP